ncbi:MAG: PQQ-binding-like beta-propeller repeat protein [Pseudomonadota bacterium]
MTFTVKRGLVVVASCIVLSACSSIFGEDEERLPGDRIPVRATAEEQRVSPTEAAAISPLTPPVANAEWTQVNGTANHVIGHLQGPQSPSVAWRRDIGDGGEDGALTSAPIVAGGSVFALDAEATVTAISAANGTVQWSRDLSPENESGSDGFGGGVAYEAGRVFATTGFGDVIALNASSGEEIWRQKMSAPLRAAPTVANGVVIAVARDNTAIAFSAEDGSIRWRAAGATSGAGILGGASAAISPGGVAILPFGSGELVALQAGTGQRLWSEVLSGGRRGLARSSISDITSDPVIQGVAVIAGNQSGRLVAIDGRNGRRGWTRDFGSQSPVWIDGQTLFVISDDAQLRRLSAQNGGTIWGTELPEYEDEEDQEDAIRYGGPVLVNGRLMLTSSEGELLIFDPQTGDQTSSVSISGLTGLGPVVANGTIYVMTSGGEIVALR